MNKYYVYASVTSIYCKKIEAESKEEAEQKAYSEGLRCGDFIGTSDFQIDSVELITEESEEIKMVLGMMDQAITLK